MRFLKQIQLRPGVSLVENLVSIVLVSVLAVSVVGAFFISRISTAHAQHRYAAMNILRQFMEEELANGYEGGSGGEGDYYQTVSSATPVQVTIDDRNTPADPSDDLLGTITPDPYPANITVVGTGENYKAIGFVVRWNEDAFGPGATPLVSERILTYVADH